MPAILWIFDHHNLADREPGKDSYLVLGQVLRGHCIWRSIGIKARTASQINANRAGVITVSHCGLALDVLINKAQALIALAYMIGDMFGTPRRVPGFSPSILIEVQYRGPAV